MTENVRLTGPLQVDETNLLIRNLKLLGLDSENGRRYTAAAVAKAAPLYEGRKVNCDHPDKPTDPRSVYDRLGKVINVRADATGLYGDLLYQPKHQMAEALLTIKDHPKLIDLYSFSHNAEGKGQNIDGVFVVEEIVSVRSVDLVADGATTKSLVEGKGKGKPIAKQTLRQIVEATDLDAKTKRAMLLEMGDELADMPMAEPAPDEGGHEDDLVAAIGKLVKDGTPESHEKVKKILAILKPEPPPEELDSTSEADDDEDKSDDEDEKDTEESGSDEIRGKNKDGQIRAMWHKDPDSGYEGRKAKRAKGATALTEDMVKSLCRLAGLPDDKELIEAAVATGDQGKAMKLLEWAKGRTAGGSRSGSFPRSQGVRKTDTMPGAAKDGKSLAKLLLARN